MGMSEVGYAYPYSGIGVGQTDQILSSNQINKNYVINKNYEIKSLIKNINEDKVTLVALSIPALISTHERIRNIGMGMVALSTAMQLSYFVYHLTTASGEKVEIKESIGFWRGIANGLYGFGQGLISPMAWWNCLQAAGKIGVQIGGQAVMSHLVHSMVKKVSHDDTLSWYKDKQTTFNSVEKELLSDIAKLAQQDIDSREREYRESSFIDLAQSLVYQMEKIVGYIKYKGLKDSVTYQQPAEKAVAYLIEATNQFARECNQVLVSVEASSGMLPASESSIVLDTTKLTQSIEDFYRKSRKIIHDFARLDTLDGVHTLALKKSKKAGAALADGAIVEVDVDTKVEN